MLNSSEIIMINGKKPNFKNVLNIDNGELIKMLKKPSCEVDTYICVDGLKMRFEDIDVAKKIQHIHVNEISNFLEFELEDCHTQDEMLQNLFRFMVVVTYKDFHFLLEPYQVNFLKSYDKYDYIFEDKPNKYCMYIEESYLYNTWIGEYEEDNMLYFKKRFVQDLMFDETSHYYEVMTYQAFSKNNGVMRVEKDKNLSSPLHSTDNEKFSNRMILKIIELISGNDLPSIDVRGEKLPPFSNNINRGVKPINNSSRIIRQMATLGRNDIFTIDMIYDETSNPVKYDCLKHEFEGDENRVLHTLSKFQKPISELNKSTVFYDMQDNIIIGHYCDVKAYMENETFKQMKKDIQSGYAFAHVIIGLGNDIVAVLHIKVNTNISKTASYFNSRYTEKHPLLHFVDNHHNHHHHNIVQKMYENGYATLHFDTDIYILFNNINIHINEMSGRLKEIGFDEYNNFEFKTSIDGRKHILQSIEEKMNHAGMKKLLINQ